MNDFQPNFGFPQARSRCRLAENLRWLAAVGTLLLLALPLRAQVPVQPTVKRGGAASSRKVAAIKSFRIVQEKDGQAVEILSTRPLVPSIQAITDPDRLVIDLPNARLDTQEKRVSVQADQISTLRADQFQQNPPVARVVVDLLAPRAYTWDAAGNRLVVHLGKSPGQARTSPFAPPTVPTLTSAPQPVAAVVRPAGPLTLVGENGSAGSSITAGPDTAVLRLSSGGEVRVCPGTTVSVTPSQNRHNLLLSMNSGALEAHFGLDASSDSVMTPDFRIVFVGPGQFHYAISADNKGNTCVRALPGNTASAIVNELLGDRTYQVKATDQLVFRSGQLDRVDMAVPLECGCPPPRDPPLRAANDLPIQSVAQDNARGGGATPPVSATPAAESAAATGGPAGAPLDGPATANELHVSVDVPFVFHATGPPPVALEEVRALPLDTRPWMRPAAVAALPPPAPARGFFRRLGGFFASIFR